MTFTILGLLLLLIVIAILLPWALWWLSQRSAIAPFIRSLEGVQAAFIGVMSMLFSLNLVFVCNEIWQAREMAKSAMSREADGLRNIGRIASNIQAHRGALILQRAREYLEIVQEVDFPADTHEGLKGGPKSKSSSSLKGVIALSDAILKDDTLGRLSPVVQQLLVSQLTVVRDKRLERLALANFTPNRVKWMALIFLEFMALLSIALVHVGNGRALFAACFVFLIGVNPFLTVLYNCQSPFSGIDPLRSSTLVEALGRLRSMEKDYTDLHSILSN